MVLDAAASAVGKMFNRLAKTLNVPVINVVKREDQKQVLINEGAQHVIVT